MLKMADECNNFDSNCDSDCKNINDNETDIENLHQLLVSAFEANFLSANFRKTKSQAQSNETNTNDGHKDMLIDMSKSKKEVEDELKIKKKKCKHKSDKDKSRKNQSNKSSDSCDSFFSSKSDRFSFNDNLDCNQERSSRRNYYDDRYFKGFPKRYNNYDVDYRYNQQSSSLYKQKERSRSRSNHDKNLKLDQQKILEIAKTNLAKMIEQHKLPQGIDVNKLKFKHLKALNEKKSVQEWAQFCKSVCEKESQTDSNSNETDSDLDTDFEENKSLSSPEVKIKLHSKTTDASELEFVKESKKNFCSNETVLFQEKRNEASHEFFSRGNFLDMKHLYELKEGNGLNYKAPEFVPSALRTAKDLQKELSQQFPVSSGNDHRNHETNRAQVEQRSPLSLSAKARIIHSLKKDVSLSYQEEHEQMFAESYQASINPNIVASQRLIAMKKFQEDPYTASNYREVYDNSQMTCGWPSLQSVSGQFMGTINPPVLNPNKLTGPSAWARKDQLITTNKIQEGIGMHLLMKMGWKPGEGLGRNNEGLVEPIMPMLKFDTKGLVSEEEKKKKSTRKYIDISEKNECNRHPVSILQEFCAKKKFTAPLYELVQVTGPDHKKAFRMKVTVNGIEYLPTLTSCSKKQAKAVAAAVCFETLQKTNPL